MSEAQDTDRAVGFFVGQSENRITGIAKAGATKGEAGNQNDKQKKPEGGKGGKS
ncbi:hypothetical protein [Palleronia sediminis]|uniref:hypothetical protein n=1 Tax=Palleronia sediminis TaxID=2547833 RepID=UPI0014551B20|nr:hypothetical protein [Palleronia sediminis]